MTQPPALTVEQLRARLEALEREGHGAKRVMVDVATEYFISVERVSIGADLQDGPERDCVVINDSECDLSVVGGKRHYGRRQ